MNLLHTVSTCTDSPYHNLRDAEGVISVNLLQEVGEDMWVDLTVDVYSLLKYCIKYFYCPENSFCL